MKKLNKPNFIQDFIFDIVFLFLLGLIIISGFIFSSCSSQTENVKPNIAWDSHLLVENVNENIDISLAGSLDAGLICVDMENHIDIDNLEPLTYTETLNILLFNSIDLHQTLVCDLVTENCITCIYAPLVWPTEVCFD